ncbi:hypothetical protein HK101_000532 [Irineochytrium annulatum]|nr:hypothetical protein HK101_000532 [Irineochytrium annulatum]
MESMPEPVGVVELDTAPVAADVDAAAEAAPVVADVVEGRLVRRGGNRRGPPPPAPFFYTDEDGWDPRLDGTGVPKVVITYAVRRAPTSSTGVVKLGRVIENEDKLIEALRQAVARWRSEEPPLRAGWEGVRRPRPELSLRAVDFATLTIEEQVAVAHGTDVWVGPHGASFIHLLHLRKSPIAGVVEMQPPERATGNFQFRNLAHALNHRYADVKIKGGLVTNINEIITKVHNVTAEVFRARRSMVLSRLEGLEYEAPLSSEEYL